MNHYRACCFISYLVCGLALSGCQHATSNQAYVPALAPDLSAAQLEEMTQVVANAVDLDSVRLHADVFSTVHILVLAPAMANTPQGRIATSRTQTRGETFHLVSNGQDCAIQHMTDKQLYPLSFSCTPVAR